MPYPSNRDLPANIRNVLPPAAQTIWRRALNSAVKQYGNETTARRVAWSQVKKQYRKGKDGKWVKKEAEFVDIPILEGDVAILPTLEEEGDGDGTLRFEGTALVDNFVSSNRRFFSKEFNDLAMGLSNDRAALPNKAITVFSRHGRAVGGFLALPTGLPIGKVVESGLFREGDRIKYRAKVVPTAEGLDMQVLIQHGVMRATSVRMYEVADKARKMDGKEVIEMLSGVVYGIDFAEEAGIDGAGINRILEEAPQWDEEEIPEEEGNMALEDLTLEELIEGRRDLLDAYAINLVGALNAKIEELEQALEEAQEDDGQVSQEDFETLQAQVEQLQLDLQIEQAAQTGVGAIVASKLREEGVGAEELEAKLPEVRSEALSIFMSQFQSEEGMSKGRTHLPEPPPEVVTEEDDERATILRLSA
jgi:cation transport regulator